MPLSYNITCKSLIEIKLFLCSSESEPPSSLVSGIIDYNMPLTSTYLKQMKLRVMNSQEQVSDVPGSACAQGLNREWGGSL